MLSLDKKENITYPSNTIDSVLVQLRFNEIFSILTDPPAKFQDIIRTKYPKVTNQIEPLSLIFNNKLNLKPNIPVQSYSFSSKDDNEKVVLSHTSISFETKKYLNFLDFKPRVLEILDSFKNIYRPSFYTRFGFRYINRIIQERIDGKKVDWSELINEALLSCYKSNLSPYITNSAHQIFLKIDNDLINLIFYDEIAADKSHERFTLDLDHFREGEIEIEGLENLLTDFNIHLSNLYNWAITEKMKDILKKK